MPKKKTKFKRHFQLLELMVAAFILLICIAPTMKIFTNIYKSQIEITRVNQRDHLAHMAHALFTEDLYKRKISLKDLDESKPINLTDSEFIELLKKFNFDCCGKFSLIPYTKKGEESPKAYLGKLEIEIKDKIKNPKDQSMVYDFNIFIDTVIDKTKNNEKEAAEEEEEADVDDESEVEEDEEEESPQASSLNDDRRTPKGKR